jgi:hypothetical protein
VLARLPQRFGDDQRLIDGSASKVVRDPVDNQDQQRAQQCSRGYDLKPLRFVALCKSPQRKAHREQACGNTHGVHDAAPDVCTEIDLSFVLARPVRHELCKDRDASDGHDRREEVINPHIDVRLRHDIDALPGPMRCEKSH